MKNNQKIGVQFLCSKQTEMLGCFHCLYHSILDYVIFQAQNHPLPLFT